jgi:hypothetical protein
MINEKTAGVGFATAEITLRASPNRGALAKAFLDEGSKSLVDLIGKRHAKRHPASTFISKVVLQFLVNRDGDEDVPEATLPRAEQVQYLIDLELLPALSYYLRSIRPDKDHPLIYAWARVLLIFSFTHLDQVVASGVIDQLERVKVGIKHSSDSRWAMFEKNLGRLHILKEGHS